ncbi:MAG: SDR family NAD(P)-dependent oxidoreductase [Thermoanaerobaculia bacterium]
MDLVGRVVLVTGAARRVGRAIALELGRRGCHVAVHYGGSQSEAEETVEALRELGVEAQALQADLRDPVAIDTLFAAFDRGFDRLDVLVNCAASFRRLAFADTTAGDWDEALAVNLRAPFLLSQRASDRMRWQPRRDSPGLIVNLGDHSGTSGWSGYAAHGVSKAGLLHLTRVAALELAPGVRVNAIVPGAILPHPDARPEDDPAFEALGRTLPLRRTGTPEQVAQAVVFLAENDFITGAVLPVDGGEHLLGGRTATGLEG